MLKTSLVFPGQIKILGQPLEGEVLKVFCGHSILHGYILLFYIQRFYTLMNSSAGATSTYLLADINSW